MTGNSYLNFSFVVRMMDTLQSQEFDSRTEDKEVNDYLDRYQYYWIGLNDQDQEGNEE